MKLGGDNWAKLEEPVTVEYKGWYAVWHGGEYIDIFNSKVGAEQSARGENPEDGHHAVSMVNTTGDEFDPAAPEDYVNSELRGWIREEG